MSLPETPSDTFITSATVVLGGDYWQGNFRFFDPCPVSKGAGHYFYVEVYEKTDKYKRTTEKVLCVPSPRPGPTGLEFTVDSKEPGEGTLVYQHALNAASHTVLVIEADSRVAVQEIPDAGSEEMITGLRNGWEYHFVVIAEGLSQQYTADAITSRVTWLGEDLYTGARPSASAPTRMHILCQVDDAEVMALLADCDDPNVSTELTAPTGVTASGGSGTVSVSWTDGANAASHMVLLLNTDFSLVAGSVQANATSPETISVAAGTYIVVVLSIDSDSEFEYDSDTVTVN